jgi:hypothetical protein
VRLAHLVAFATVTLAASLTGCASHHPPTPAAATDESDTAVGTSCEAGDPACTCVDIDGGAYDHVCKVDSDCVAITVGTICGAASCLPANTAVNKDSYAAFQQDRQQVEYASCVPVANGAVSCVSNACVLQGAAGPVGSGRGQADGGSSAGDGSTDDGTGTGIEIDLGDDDDDDTTVTVPDPPSAGDDDDDDGNGNGGSSSGDDDDDDKDGKRHPHPQSRHGHGATHVQSPAVTDILE